MLLSEAFLLLQDPSWLSGSCTPQGWVPGRVPGQVRCRKRNQIIGLKEDKVPEELPNINDPTACLPNSSSLGGLPTPFLSACASLPCFYLNSFSVWSPTCCCVVSLTVNFVPAFAVSASVINELFTEGKDPGEKQLLAGSPGRVWWLGFLVFTQATQVRLLGRALRLGCMPLLAAAWPRPALLSYQRKPLELVWILLWVCVYMSVLVPESKSRSLFLVLTFIEGPSNLNVDSCSSESEACECD